ATRARARAARAQPLDPANIWNIGWKADGTVPHAVLPEALTGLRSPLVVLSGRRFPTGSHKVGPAYSILVEKQLEGECVPGEHTLVFPSTGNFGIGGAWVGPRMGYRSLVVLPAEMSAERFEKIEAYGATAVKTPGSESNVKEIYDKARELREERGKRRIEGMRDKHVTWIHNVWATDLLVCVDDQECLEGLQLLQEGVDVLTGEGIPEDTALSWAGFFGISGVCNVLAGIKAARYYG